jgi:hypothetical protein
MVFANRSNLTVKIYWLDFQGHRRLYRSVPPGDKTTQNTFIGHNWLIADPTRRVHRNFRSGARVPRLFLSTTATPSLSR